MVNKKSKLEKTKDKYFDLYHSWKYVRCPALSADVHFTRLGWNHLCVTKWRTGPEQMRRMEILPLSKKLISITTTIQEIRHLDGFKTYEFNAVMGGIKVVAVISEVKGKCYFLSNKF
jgi:hypothetical protein